VPVGAERRQAGVLVAALMGAVVALSLGVYGNVHDPTGRALFTLFFTSTLNLKAWFATVAATFGLFQLFSALRMFGKIKLPRTMPEWWGNAHRLSGTAAFLFSLPVAYHCLWSLGFQDLDARRLVHSVVGCLFYGAFAAKIVIVRSKNLPGWALPLAGGVLFTALMVVWLTSSFWFFRNFGFPAI
jgi:ABC-type uncharacterized transport system permease subunit